MPATQSVSRLFVVSKRIVQVGVPLAIAAWIALLFILNGLTFFELMILVAVPILAACVCWVLAWISEAVTLSQNDTLR
jgi:hypothetical protein